MDDGAGDRAEALGQVVAVSARQRRLAPADRHDRPVSVPLRLEQPARTARQDIGDRRELRARRDGSLGRRVLPQEEPVPLVPVEVRGDERPDAVDPLPPEPEGEAAVGLLLQELVRPAVPDLDRAGAVLAGRDRRPRRSRSRADDPRRGPRGAVRRPRGGAPSARPSWRGRRPARAAGRSGAAGRRGAGRRRPGRRPTGVRRTARVCAAGRACAGSRRAGARPRSSHARGALNIASYRDRQNPCSTGIRNRG